MLKPINCRRCDYEIARTDGAHIYFGEHKVPMVATGLSFLCPQCKREGKWRRTTTDRKELHSKHN